MVLVHAPSNRLVRVHMMAIPRTAGGPRTTILQYCEAFHTFLITRMYWITQPSTSLFHELSPLLSPPGRKAWPETMYSLVSTCMCAWVPEQNLYPWFFTWVCYSATWKQLNKTCFSDFHDWLWLASKVCSSSPLWTKCLESQNVISMKLLAHILTRLRKKCHLNLF